MFVLVDQSELALLAADDHDGPPAARRIVAPSTATGIPVASPCTASSTSTPRVGEAVSQQPLRLGAQLTAAERPVGIAPGTVGGHLHPAPVPAAPP